VTPILEARGRTEHLRPSRAPAGLDLLVDPGRVAALQGAR